MMRLFDRSADLVALWKAERYARQALSMYPYGNPNRLISLHNISIVLRARFEHCGTFDDLKESIAFTCEALALDTKDGHERVSLTSNLAFSVESYFERTRRLGDLDLSIDIHREALAMMRGDHSSRSKLVRGLCASLEDRFERSSQSEDLEAAIACRQYLSSLGSHESQEYSSMMARLEVSTWIKTSRKEFLRSVLPGPEETWHSEETIAFLRVNVAFFPVGHELRPALLNSLAAHILARFVEFERLEDLEESISLFRDSLTLLPEGDPARAHLPFLLGPFLDCRFEQSGKIDDLEESITFHREALEAYVEGPDRSLLLVRLARSLSARFEQNDRMEDLDEAINLQRIALTLRPEGHLDRVPSLNNLGSSLRTRFERKGQMEDLEEAISLHRVALVLRSEGHPNRASSLNNLAASLDTRFGQKGQMEDLEEAISLYRAALALLPEGHPDHSESLNNLAISVLTRFKQKGRMDDLDLATQLFASATDHEFSSLVTRLDIAIRWSRVARSHSRSTALRAYEAALSLLERSLSIGPMLRSQHDHLSSKGSIKRFALDAASYAIEMGDLQKAIEILEQGRGLLWSQMRGFRTPLDSLAEINKPLADEFKDINQRLQALSTPESHLSSLAVQSTMSSAGVPGVQSNRVLFDNRLNEKRRLSEEQKKLIAQIRDVPGFEDFLKATPFDMLNAAAEDGPVVIINHSSYRCDVLILLRDSPPAHIPLDAGFYKDSLEFWMLLVNTRIEFKPRSPEYNLILGQVMQMLWDRVVSLVVEKLKELGVPDEAHVWWCPTSILTEFPFHAAGSFASADGEQKCFLDSYVSSYTPTLKALIDARCNIPRQKQKLLIVAVPGRPRAASLAGVEEEIGFLPSVAEEIGIIRSYRMPTSTLINDEASRDAVVKALREHTWVHFTCHGSLAPKPFDSSFRLFDSRLTLYDIARERIPSAEFAFLSPCHTADQSLNFAASDEVLHLAAGMQFCGFRSVIGTMWQMADIDGPHMAREVYGFMMKQKKGGPRFKSAAAALRSAVLELKEKFKMHGNPSLERWVNYVHIGA